MRAAVARVAGGLVAATLAVPVAAVPALAAGTGGVDLAPAAGVGPDGRPPTAFRVSVPPNGRAAERMTLRNLTAAPQTASLYAAAVDRDATGGYLVRGPGSTSYVRLPVATVTLRPREVRSVSFTVNAPDLAPGRTAYAAVVVAQTGAAVTRRAATLVYLTASDSTARRALLPALLAAALLAAVASGWGVAARSRR